MDMGGVPELKRSESSAVAAMIGSKMVNKGKTSIPAARGKAAAPERRLQKMRTEKAFLTMPVPYAGRFFTRSGE
jgi:hypothetical protein